MSTKKTAPGGEVSAEITVGSTTNEVGFGWTNGVFLELLEILKQA